MVDLDRVRPIRTIRVELTHETLDGLLFDWLDELIGTKDADALVLSEFEVTVEQTATVFTLKATARGEPLRADLPVRLDVKAPTAHGLVVTSADGGWLARVVLDV
jgi:SHS2 domain-containing protein